MSSAPITASFLPRVVDTIEESGLTSGSVNELVLKHIFVAGSITLGKLVDRTKLSPTIIHGAFRHFQREQLCETRGMVGEDYEITLTSKGRSMADAAFTKSQYVGPAPVPLTDYGAAVRAQGAHADVTLQRLASAFEDLVLADELIHQLGSALAMGGAVLLYGGTGNGKTSIAERLHGIFTDHVYIPHAVEVSGVTIGVFDPAVHEPDPQQPDNVDPRWVLCSRPMVKVGGEMRAEMLEPRMDEVTRVCIGPLQMKANNGILLIDDFGRQRITPRELLNRWIVPLDRRTDVMSLWSGVTFQIPFEMLVVFSTNLNLGDLAEDAFMRRLKNKIRIGALTPDLFKELLGRVCRQHELTCAPEIEDYVVEQCAKHSPDGLRGCYPADLVSIVAGIAKFEQRPPELDRDNVDRALKVYFVQ